jgi:hypothetical protein
MPVTRSQAIKNFLTDNTHPDLAALDEPGYEVQVNVAQGHGDRVNKEFKGRQYTEYTDGFETWRPFRLPLKANSTPEENDYEMTFSLDRYAEAIGLSGWSYKDRVSRWVAFDFDSIVGHAEGLGDEELAEVWKKATGIPWVTVRKSTGGIGIHLYVFFATPIPTADHTAHAALAQAVLGLMSALAGFDFKAKVDCAGGIVWVWARRMVGTDGLTLIKQGEPLKDVPAGWRENLPVATGRRRQTFPQVPLTRDGRPDRDRLFDELTGDNVSLDSEHERLIDWLLEQRAPVAWREDRNMLVTHTYWLKEAHKALKLKGPFETVSTGRNRMTDINVYAYPLRNGAWVVRRYGTGVAEAPTWHRDRSGNTRCFFNRDPLVKGSGDGFSLFIPLKTPSAAKAAGI